MRCTACDGYGWVEEEADDFGGEAEGIECKWCGGIGYVYRDEKGVSRRIPPEDYATQAETLERLELERLREIGYTGQAKQPWQQQIRIERGDRIAKPPEETDTEE